MPLQTRQIEELFLKIFKVAVLAFMALSLVAVLFLALNAAYQTTKTPSEPAPAQKAPTKEVSMEELRKLLQKEAQPGEPKTSPAQPTSMAPSLLYLEDVTRLYRCSVEFARKVNAEISGEDNATAAERVETLRAEVEGFAADKRRGERWVKATTDFTCAALADPIIIALRKDGKLKSVFIPILNFHKFAWDAIEEDKAAFEQAELERVQTERMAEQLRIAEARANAVSSAIAAAMAFGIFMLLAIYLIGAKIETNLRDMNETLRASAKA